MSIRQDCAGMVLAEAVHEWYSPEAVHKWLGPLAGAALSLIAL